jgi:hypothetical protein
VILVAARLRFKTDAMVIGTFISAAAVTNFRLLKLRLRSYLRHAFLLPIPLTIPLVAVLLLLRRWFIPHHFLQLVEQVSIGLAVYGVGIAWAIWTRQAWRVEGRSYDERDAELGVELVETSRQEA